MIEFFSAEDMKSGRGGKGGSGVHYSKYTDAIAPMVPHLKEQIAASKDGIIRVKNKDIAKELGGTFAKLNVTSIYWGLKASLFEQGIVVNTGTHRDGDKILTMRTREKDDVLPKSLTKNKKESGPVAAEADEADLPEDDELDPEQ